MIDALSSFVPSTTGSRLHRLTCIRYFSSKDCLGSQGLDVRKHTIQLSITQNPNQTQDSPFQPRFESSFLMLRASSAPPLPKSLPRLSLAKSKEARTGGNSSPFWIWAFEFLPSLEFRVWGLEFRPKEGNLLRILSITQNPSHAQTLPSSLDSNFGFALRGPSPSPTMKEELKRNLLPYHGSMLRASPTPPFSKGELKGDLSLF
jgi:hypothetical protein